MLSANTIAIYKKEIASFKRDIKRLKKDHPTAHNLSINFYEEQIVMREAEMEG